MKSNLAVVFLGLFMVLGIAGCEDSSDDDLADEYLLMQSTYPSMSVGELISCYEADADAADDEYLNTYVLVSGYVYGGETLTDLDVYLVNLVESNQVITCVFREAVSELDSIVLGDYVMIGGICRGETTPSSAITDLATVYDPWLDSCDYVVIY